MITFCRWSASSSSSANRNSSVTGPAASSSISDCRPAEQGVHKSFVPPPPSGSGAPQWDDFHLVEQLGRCLFRAELKLLCD